MLDSDHYVDLAGGRFASTSPKDLEHIFAAYASSAYSTLLVHFHGGLNTRAEGIQRVSRLAPLYLEAGAYPVFFVWQSWVSEVVQNGVTEIFAEKIYRQAVTRIKEFVLEKIRNTPRPRGAESDSAEALALQRELRALVDDPAASIAISTAQRDRVFSLTERERRRFRDSILNDAVVRTEISAIANAQLRGELDRRDRSSVPLQGIRQTRMSPEFLATLGISRQTDRMDVSLGFAVGLVKVLARVCKRLAQSRDHGLLVTIVEEVLRNFYFVEGWFSWMKSQIEDAFRPDPVHYGGTAFLLQLRAIRTAGHRPRVILVGHSAGSIYACNFLDNARLIVPDQKFDVVFLTPAVSFERFTATLQASADGIGDIKSISLDDPTEREDRWLPHVPNAYPASLLYFTSGVMEPDRYGNGDVAVVGMQRFFSASVPLDSPGFNRVREFFAAGPERLAWSAARFGGEDAPGTVPVGRHHGGFDEDAGTRSVLRRIISVGF